jgi:hypothetical protein
MIRLHSLLFVMHSLNCSLWLLHPNQLLRKSMIFPFFFPGPWALLDRTIVRVDNCLLECQGKCKCDEL